MSSWQPLFAAALDDRSNAPILSTLHFDLRAPEFGTPAEELFAAALEMSEFADKHGFASINLSEHHGSSDGYNPSPSSSVGPSPPAPDGSALASVPSSVPCTIPCALPRTLPCWT